MKYLRVAVGFGILIAIAAVVRWVGMPEPVAHRPLADTLAATKTRDSVFVVAKIDSGDRNLRLSLAANARATRATAVADSTKVVADSLETSARTRDSSAKAWQAVAEARGREADNLGIALAEQRERADRAERSALFYKAANDTLLRRNRQLEDLKAGYEKDMKKMEPKCSIGPVPCPPRWVYGVTGFAAGAAIRR